MGKWMPETWRLFSAAYGTRAGDASWNPACDLATPANGVIDRDDLAVLVGDWSQSRPNITVRRVEAQIELSWPFGILDEASDVTGPWTPVTGAAAPSQRITPSERCKFYRIR